MIKERRESPRIKKSFPVYCTSVGKGLLGKGIGRNISREGLGIEIESSFSLGEDVKMEIYLPSGKKTFYSIELIGKVVWARKNNESRRDFCNNYFMGVRFLEIDKEINERLVSL
ncbi:MAG: PilZ domain-containing protein [Nitrospirae bacterium]|nr:PilZ domain-containing protein [Nitrospirota bacterium]